MQATTASPRRQPTPEVHPSLGVQGAFCACLISCQVVCKPGYALPGGSTTTLLVCEEGEWHDRAQSKGQPIPDCQGELVAHTGTFHSPAVCLPACLHGGVCIRPGTCHCPAPWEGDHCQAEKGSPCLESPPTPANSRVFCSSNQRSGQSSCSTCAGSVLHPACLATSYLAGSLRPPSAAGRGSGILPRTARVGWWVRDNLASQPCVSRRASTEVGAWLVTSVCVGNTTGASSASMVGHQGSFIVCPP